ncbi:hypothetical protein M1105_11060 [Limibaculum sp. FT325]|uniref:NepR family anti-sigma factor n=1 Tax=Thermohalobaculum sediminis TaxID=2939436 RepID=UPI0020C17352|nr:NepR family anti-sigma factor [Limibaculum sediminis]MCL5777523.1 hypothetical protein [Limibaculum sediminis]
MTTTKTSAAEPRKARITEFDGTAEDPITVQLRRLYDDAVAEPLPEHLLHLLERLAEAEAKR